MNSRIGQLGKRIYGFRKKSALQKFQSYGYRWRRWFPGVPALVRLPFGIWWLMDEDYIGQCLLDGGYEAEECEFVMQFLKPGMKVVDIGAHRGFYTLLFSKMVGNKGKVLSFEPSPHDLKRMKLNLRLNFVRNVKTKNLALGEENGSANLYFVPDNSVCNSLRPPDTPFPASCVTVPLRKLDDVLSEEGPEKIDFVKLDVEGGEMSVLKGAEKLLTRVPRPVFLCEVLDQRTRPWGYPARMIVEFLLAKAFSWFELEADGKVSPLDLSRSELGGNFVAVPVESLGLVAHAKGL